ncbi:MAG: hypothetical protein U9O06_11370 [Euryarchaeota archaeon]|nr:hypothetical protein [Euryarchaeota archaeon]
MSDPVITADELASYVVCPTQYEFEHVRPISPRTDHSDVTFDRRRELLADGLLAGLTADVETTEARASLATDRTVEKWPKTVPSYVNEQQQQFDSELLEATISNYFERFGAEHAEGLVETNPVLGSSFDGIRYETEVDALVETESGHRAIRFLPNLYGVHPAWKDEGLVEAYLSRSEFYPRQIGHLVRAWTALRGLLSAHGMDADVEFTYVSLFDDVRISYGAGSDPTASVTMRHFQELFESERGEIRTLLRDMGPKIIDGEYAIPDADRSLIADNCCEFCPYQDACPAYIRSDVAFGDRAVQEDGN